MWQDGGLVRKIVRIMCSIQARPGLATAWIWHSSHVFSARLFEIDDAMRYGLLCSNMLDLNCSLNLRIIFIIYYVAWDIVKNHMMYSTLWKVEKSLCLQWITLSSAFSLEVNFLVGLLLFLNSLDGKHCHISRCAFHNSVHGLAESIERHFLPLACAVSPHMNSFYLRFTYVRLRTPPVGRYTDSFDDGEWMRPIQINNDWSFQTNRMISQTLARHIFFFWYFSKIYLLTWITEKYTKTVL